MFPKCSILQNLEVADVLIAYLEKLSGKGDKKDYIDSNETEKVQVQPNINPEDLNKLLKKEKLTVLVSKKEQSDKSKEIFGGNNKKGKGGKLKD